jgi:plasmid rolling circle replication initiator protein Rep
MNLSLLTRHESKPLKKSEIVQSAPSLDTVQQVDIREREFRRASQRKGERWSLRTATKKDIISRLDQFDHKAALRMKQCCSVFKATTCGQHTVKCYPTFRCKKLICPDCASERGARLSRQTEAKIAEVMKTTRGRLCFLTLTIKNTPTYEGGLSKLKKDFAKFKRKKAFKQHIKGYLGAFECTCNLKTDDFHVHMHLIVLRGKFWNQSDISDTWCEVTGDSFVVDIREIKDIRKGVKEVCKYIVKSTDLMKMPDDKFLEVVKMKKGTRMFVSGGCFYNVKLDDALDGDGDGADDVFSQFADLKEGDLCPFCNGMLFDVLVDRESHIGLQQLNAMPNIVKNNSS